MAHAVHGLLDARQSRGRLRRPEARVLMPDHNSEGLGENEESHRVTCKVDGCERAIQSRGLCQTHYDQQRRGEELRAIGPYGRSGCTFPGCERSHSAKGWCKAHYEQQRRGKSLTPVDEARLCEFTECDRPHYAHGLCQAHYDQRRRGKSLTPIGEVRLCEVDGCGRKHYGLGLCGGHYNQQVKGRSLSPLRGSGGRLFHEEAVDRVKEIWPSFSPSVPFTETNAPWPGVCLNCGQPIKPYLASAESQGPCPYCAKKRLDPAIAVGKMMAADLTPLSPFVKSTQPWECVCNRCGRIVRPAFNDVDQGQGGCSHCAAYGFDGTAPALLYVVASERWVKVGITNVRNATYRLKRHATQGLNEVLHTRYFDRGSDAREMELTWLAYVKSAPKGIRATKDDVPDGHTEAIRNNAEIHRWLDENLINRPDDRMGPDNF